MLDVGMTDGVENVVEDRDVLVDIDEWDEPTIPWHREGRTIISMCDGWF